jgi:hypothetical protein
VVAAALAIALAHLRRPVADEPPDDETGSDGV